MVFSSMTCARSASSIMCWVPILVALRRPDRIQRRTVSGSRLVRRAASGTVNTVATYYNKLRPAHSWLLLLEDPLDVRELALIRDDVDP